MKKILFLLLVCLIKLNAYEFLYYYNSTNDYFYFDNSSGHLMLGGRNRETGELLSSTYLHYDNLNYVKFGGPRYINSKTFDSYIKSDVNFINDLLSNYHNYRNMTLNYFYNENKFSSSNHIDYENYQILYNSDGLAVESIVNGNWAGLYDGPDNSGYLYNEKGDLLYINGVSPSFLESSFSKLTKKFKINLESIFIKKIFYPLLVLIFACVIFRSVIRMAFKAFLIRFYDKKIGQLEKRRENIENA